MHSISLFANVVVTMLLHYTIASTDQLPNIIQIVNKDSRFKVLSMALKAAAITEEDDLEGPYTLFAPNDAAFNAVPSDVVQRLSDPKNREELGRVLAYHAVVNQSLPAAQIHAMSLPRRLQTLTGDFVTVSKQNNQIKVNDATVIASDIKASNGIIHVIDKVLIPPPEKDFSSRIGA